MQSGGTSLVITCQSPVLEGSRSRIVRGSVTFWYHFLRERKLTNLFRGDGPGPLILIQIPNLIVEE
jgi:hypothetical protein